MFLASLTSIESIHPLARQFGQHSDLDRLRNSAKTQAEWQTWTNQTRGGRGPFKRA